VDKKVRGGVMRFAWIDAIGRPAFVDDVSDGEIAAALEPLQPR
jgi:3-dehydroquinate synthetase